MFKLYATDCSPRDLDVFYKIEFDKAYTVKEFIEAVLSNTNDRGSISINRGKRTIEQIGYEQGKLTSSKNLSPKILNTKVLSASAMASWAGMSYTLECNNTLENSCLYKGIEKPLYKSSYDKKSTLDCLNCKNSFSLPAGDTFDDGSVSDVDRLVCVKDKTAKIVQDNGYCDFHSENVEDLNEAGGIKHE